MFNWKKDKKGNGNESYTNETKNTFSHNDMISNDWDFDTDPNQQEDIDPIYLYDAIKPKNTSYYSEGINRDGDYLSELAKGDEFKQRTLTDADYNSISGVHRETFLRSASDIPRDNSGRPGANIQPGFGNQALNSYYEHEHEGSSEPERKTTPIFTRVNREETITSSFDSDNYGNGNFNSDNYDTKNYNSDSETSKTYGGSSFGGNTYGGSTYGGSSFDTGNFGTDDFDIDDNSVGSGNFGSGNFGGGNFDSGNFGGGNFDSGNFGGGNFDSGNFGGGNFDSGNFGGGNFDSGNFGGDNFDSGNFGSASFGAGGFGSANFDASSAAANRAMNEKKEEEKPKNSGVGFDSLMSDNFGGNFDDGDFANASYGVGGFGSANFTPGSASSTPSFGTSSSNPFQNDKRGGFDDLNNEFGGGNFDSGNIGVSGFGSASFGSGSFSGTNTGAAYANDGASGTGTMTYNSSSSSEEVSMNAGGYDGYGTDFYGNGYGSAPEESSVSSADIANAFAEFGDGPVNSFSSIKKEESNFGDFDYEYVPPVSPADEEPPEAVPHVKVDKPTYVYQRRTLGASSEAAEETKEAVAEEPAVATEEVAEAVNEEVVDEPATATVETKTEPVVVEHKFETAEEIRARASIRREEVKTEETEPEETKTEENKSEEIESESVEVKAEEPKEEEPKKEEPKKSSASFYSPNSIFSLGPDEEDKFAHLRRHSDHVSMQARDIIAEINHFGETDEERQAAKEAKAKEEAEANAKTEVAEDVTEEVVEEAAEAAEEVTEEVAEVAEEVTEEVVEEAAEVAEEVTEEVVEEAAEVAEGVTEEVVKEAAEVAEEVTEEVVEEAAEAAEEVTEEVVEEAAEEVTDDLTEIMESVKDLDDMTVIEMLNEAVSNSESSDDDFDDEYGDEPVVNDSSRDYGDVDKVLEEALGSDYFAQQSVSEIVEETTEEPVYGAIEEATEVVEEVTEEVVEEVAEEVIEEATEEVTEEVAEEVAEEVIEEATEEVTEEVAEEIAEEVIEEATEEVAEEIAEEVIEEATEEVAEEIAEEVIEEATEEVTEEVAEEVAEEVIEEVTEEVTEEVADEEPVYGAYEEPVYGAITEPVVEEVVEEVIEEATEEVAEEVAEEVIEETTEEVAEEVTDEEPVYSAYEEPVYGTITEPVVEEVTEETVEETVEESAEEIAEEVAEELAEDIVEATVEEPSVEEALVETIEETIEEPVEESVTEESEEVAEEAEELDEEDYEDEVIDIDSEEGVEEDSEESEEESEEKSEETKKTENAFDPAQWFNSMMEMMGFGMGTGAKAPETKASAETEDDKSEEDEAEKSDETKSYSGSYTDGFEEVCSICRRTESKAGKMMHMPPNLCVCADCMQRTMDSFSSFGLGGNSSLEEELSKLTGGNGMPGFGFINLANMQGEGAVPNKQKIKKKSKETKAAPIIDIKRIPAPHKIRETLDEYIVGQDHAKKIMSVAVYNHYKRVACDVNDEIEIEKSNMLMIGPTGSGKTYLVKTLARILDVPLAIADATSLTEAGYIGDDIESVVSKLLAAADNDVERAEKGIIYIDEIDKIAKKANTNSRDVSGESVQQGMLKLLEGAQIEVPVGATSKGAMVPLTTIDTRNILFICGGAFPDLQDIIKERLSKSSSIGFGATLKDEYNNDKDILHKVKIEDIRKFGMIPEFIGRLPIIYSLDAVTRDMLIRILKEPKNAILKQYQKLLALDDVNLVFTDDAIEAIADKALAQDTGARALRSCIEDFMLDIMYEIPKDDNIGTVTITADYINGVGGPIIGIRGNEEPEIVTKTEGDDNE